MNTDSITERLDIVISLLIPAFDEGNYTFTGVTLDILRLSDGTNTRDDMIKKTKKNAKVIDPILSKLRSQNFIKSITKDSRTFYIRLK